MAAPLAAIYRNPQPRKSGNLGTSALTLAASVARQLGMVPTWPNVQTIRLAIESEAELSGVTTDDSATVIVKAAREHTAIENPLCPDWARREICRFNTVNRFWFEDARWREKCVYLEFRASLTQTTATE